LISYEDYWQRACKEHFKIPDCSLHGNSWKQCYAEIFIKRLVTNFNAEKGDTIQGMLKYFDIMKFYIFNLEIPTFSSDFDISKIPEYFVNLSSLELKYSPVLKDKGEKEVLKKKLTRINNI
jgi:hypothetical protein